VSRPPRTGQGCCLDDVAAALVDGELDHASRERAHRHLAHCAPCRAEVEAQRRLKARLSGVEQVQPSAALTDRLLRIAAPAPEPGAGPPDARPPARPVTVTTGISTGLSTGPVTRPAGGPGRPADARRGGTGPLPARPRGARRRPARRRATTSSAIVLLGVAAALALGAPQPRSATTPVDPTTDAFVAEFVSTTGDGGSPAVAPASSARTAGLTTFVPLTRSALLSTGGARTTR
jgi:hypothetical protein